MVRKIFIPLVAFLLFCTFFSIPVGSASQVSPELGCSCAQQNVSEDELSNLNSNNEFFESLTHQQTNKALENLNSFQDYKKVSQWFETNGIIVKTKDIIGIKLNEYVHPITKEKYDDIVQISYYGASNNYDKIGAVVAYINESKNELIHLQGQIFFEFKEENGEYKNAKSYIHSIGYSPLLESGDFENYLSYVYQSNTNSDSEVMLSSKSAERVCGMVGVVVCAQHCGIWGLGCGPVCGTICGLICGTTFVFTCS
ncbi:hypothetical protein J40TS1_32120 [Paenibacillus montaniterrae]|uniref:Uncharacterized protein n=1 Tax=Paenibacillus montaniterrae TaxID=429341 RepID=A0A920CYM6_9BACL|nr:putative immunity/bacteriocin fusion bifunctional protein [Paenibacillus montaniterrae]GIP17570.1 hypothetical protein J40TS1_32120 [Paenibacillus montaniterrae]